MYLMSAETRLRVMVVLYRILRLVVETLTGYCWRVLVLGPLDYDILRLGAVGVGVTIRGWQSWPEMRLSLHLNMNNEYK